MKNFIISEAKEFGHCLRGHGKLLGSLLTVGKEMHKVI